MNMVITPSVEVLLLEATFCFAKLFAETLLSLLDWAVTGRLDYYESGVECFDNLTFGLRISAFAVIGNGLLRKDTPLVRLTAVLEGTIAAIFEYLRRSSPQRGLSTMNGLNLSGLWQNGHSDNNFGSSQASSGSSKQGD